MLEENDMLILSFKFLNEWYLKILVDDVGVCLVVSPPNILNLFKI